MFMDEQGYPHVSGVCPPVVWSSPTKYYPGSRTGAAADTPTAAHICSQHHGALLQNAQGSRALLILQEKLLTVSNDSRQQLAHAAAAFQQQLAAVEAAAAAKQDVLQERLVQQAQRQHQLRLLRSCTSAWRHQHQRHAYHAQQRQVLKWSVRAWRQLAHANRQAHISALTSAFTCWCAVAAQHKVNARLLQRLRQCHLRRLLLAWLQHSMAQQECFRQALLWAARFSCRRVLHRCTSSWLNHCRTKQQLLHGFMKEQQRGRLQLQLQGWHHLVQQELAVQHQQRHSQQAAAAQAQQTLLRAWTVWWHQVAAAQQTAGLHYKEHLLQLALTRWLQLPAVQLRLRAISAAIGRVYEQLLLQWGLRGFISCCSEAVAARRATRQCLRAWAGAAAASATCRHWMKARAAARRKAVLKACLGCWVRVMWQAGTVENSRLQAALGSCEAQLACKCSELSLLQGHQQQLLECVTRAGRAAAPDLPLAPTLLWQYLQCRSAAQQILIEPRARHAVFALSGLQPTQMLCGRLQQLAQPVSTQGVMHTDHQAALYTGADHGMFSLGAERAPPVGSGARAGMLGCLVIFGGMAAGGHWLSDVTLMPIWDSDSSAGCSAKAVTVPQEAGHEATSSNAPASAAQVVNSSLPVPVCDFAACECGAAAFMVVGGFDGQHPTMQLQMCTLSRSQEAAAATATAAARRRSKPDAGASPTATAAATGSAWSQGWRCRWDLIQARTRTPPGRCHHSSCWHAESRSVLVFGGYASRQGCLNDVQVFNMDHMEWWQPGDSGQGPWPSCRRAHAAVVMDSKLWVHGGLDSNGRHLQDLWQLDLKTWRWRQLLAGQPGVSEGVCPSARRAHCLEAAQGRFLLLHGGYSGTSQLLQDTWAYDTHSDCWLPVDVQAAGAQQPVGRALHSLTYLAHRFFVVGGQTSLGPLSQVGVLCSPALLHTLQLQQEGYQQQEQLVQLKQQQLKLQAQLQGCQLQVQHGEAVTKAMAKQMASAEDLAAGLSHQNSMAHRALAAAKEAGVAAESRAVSAEAVAATLQRRLVRARQGGIKALAAATQCQSTEATC